MTLAPGGYGGRGRRPAHAHAAPRRTFLTRAALLPFPLRSNAPGEARLQAATHPAARIPPHPKRAPSAPPPPLPTASSSTTCRSSSSGKAMPRERRCPPPAPPAARPPHLSTLCTEAHEVLPPLLPHLTIFEALQLAATCGTLHAAVRRAWRPRRLRLVLAASASARLVLLNPLTGALLGSAECGRAPGEEGEEDMSWPTSVAVDAARRVAWVCEHIFGGRLHAFRLPSLQLCATVPLVGRPGEPSWFSAEGVVLAPDGRLFVAGCGCRAGTSAPRRSTLRCDATSSAHVPPLPPSPPPQTRCAAFARPRHASSQLCRMGEAAGACSTSAACLSKACRGGWRSALTARSTWHATLTLKPICPPMARCPQASGSGACSAWSRRLQVRGCSRRGGVGFGGCVGPSTRFALGPTLPAHLRCWPPPTARRARGRTPRCARADELLHWRQAGAAVGGEL